MERKKKIMEINKLSAIAFIAVILGATGLGVGAYSVISVQTGAVKGGDGVDGANGDDGADGDDGATGQEGDDGQDAPGDIVIGILDLDEGETVSGTVIIRAMVAGSENYNIKVLINASLNATCVPFTWNTTKLSDGWWNVTIIATDIATNDVSQDEVIVYVKNRDTTDPIVYIISPHDGQTVWDNITINAMILEDSAHTVKVLINGSLNAICVPFEWDTTQLSEGWWNVTVIVTDNDGNIGQDTVIVLVDSTPYTGHVLQTITDVDWLSDDGDYAFPHTYHTISMDVSEGSDLFIIWSTTIRASDGRPDYPGDFCIRLYLDSWREVAKQYHWMLDSSVYINLPVTISAVVEDLSAGTHQIDFQGGYINDLTDLCYNSGSRTTYTVMEIGG